MRSDDVPGRSRDRLQSGGKIHRAHDGPGGLREGLHPFQMAELVALGVELLGAVAQDLHEASGPIPQRHQEAGGVETRAVLAHVPALVLGAPLGGGNPHLLLGYARLLILRGEDQTSMMAQHLLFGPAVDEVGTLVPGGDVTVGIHGEDRVTGRALQDQVLALLGSG
jgi:hypothetical protein